jgi:hypothetical protein
MICAVISEVILRAVCSAEAVLLAYIGVCWVGAIRAATHWLHVSKGPSGATERRTYC